MLEDKCMPRVVIAGIPWETIECIQVSLAAIARVDPIEMADVMGAVRAGGVAGVVLSWVVGGEDGTGTLAQMRADPAGRDLPVIFVLDPVLADHDVGELLQSHSVSAIYPYPIACDLLVRAIRRLLLSRVAVLPASEDTDGMSPQDAGAADAEDDSLGRDGENGTKDPPLSESAASAGDAEYTPFVLVIGDDRSVAAPILQEMESRGIRAELVPTAGDARDLLSREGPDAVLLDLALAADAQDGLTLLQDLRADFPKVPVVVLTGRDSLGERLAVAANGGSGFLQKTLSPGEVVDSLTHLLDRPDPNKRRVLVVNDDPIILAGLQEWLQRQSIGVTTLEDPLRFWDVLERSVPDVLVIDLDLPLLDGAALCRALRNDSRWKALSVVFLTDDRNPSTVRRVFEAGGDDLVSKTAMSPELTLKIINRLQRAEIIRELSESDPLTGIANRRKATETVRFFLGLAQRQNLPMSVAIVDIDDFKAINDEFGHPIGDAVLRHIAQVLRRHFKRSSDVIARWGGEEFLVAMYGLTKEQGVVVLEDVLGRAREGTPLGSAGLLTFSAGVAEFPQDGRDVPGLYRSADRAELRAKAMGKDRVVAVNWEDLIEE